jgi:hypothetical protein
MDNLTIAQLQAQLAAATSRIAQLEEENKELKAHIDELSVNPNFNTLTRVAGLEKARRELKERRKNSSSQKILVTVDIGGMGASNSSRGETSTNAAMTSLLEEIRTSFREGDIQLFCDSQLNSGDEFLFWLEVSSSLSDLSGILARLDSLAIKHGFSGAYCGTVTVPPNIDISRDWLVELANLGMETVYEVKKQRKAAKASV